MSGEIVSRVYCNFKGVDFRGDEIYLTRSPDALNVWKDYKEIDSIRTRPGMELVSEFSDTIYGIFFFNGVCLVHSGRRLYRLDDGVKTVLYSGLRAAESSGFAYEDRFFIKDGLHYIKFDGSTCSDVVGYVPTTSIARKPEGGGTIHEDVNLLTGRRINTFLGDGKSRIYNLDTREIDADFFPIVKINDRVTKQFTVSYVNGRITFTDPPPAPLTDGQDNVSIEFKKVVPEYRDLIEKCSLLQVFDNRVFFAGNPDRPSTVWHCSLDNPEYCSDLDYYNEGLDEAPIRGLVAGNNALWVFREPSSANTTVFYHMPTVDSEYGKIYPSQHSSIAIGCTAKAINFNDDIVFFSDRGMEGISGDITTEQTLAHRSSMVDRKLLGESGYESMVLAEWEGYLLVFIGKKAYLADSRSAFTSTDHIEYEWFYWEMEQPITAACVHDGVLYLGTEFGLYTLTKQETDFESHWVTPKDKFKYPSRLKTTNKRGCVAEATGDITVYAKVEDTEFEPVGSYSDVTDYFVSRIKRKKFKDIQLKFASKSKFALETVTLECFVGAYVKR